MTDKVFYSKPTDQTNQDNNMMLFGIITVILAVIFLFTFFSKITNNKAENTSITIPQPVTPTPEENLEREITPDPQDPQLNETLTIPTPSF